MAVSSTLDALTYSPWPSFKFSCAVRILNQSNENTFQNESKKSVHKVRRSPQKKSMYLANLMRNKK